MKLENVKELRQLELREVTAKFRSLENVLQKTPIAWGLGEPEGVAVAPVGYIYMRLDGVPGATFYVKESGGVTSTGWVAK